MTAEVARRVAERRACWNCTHFRNDPAYLETQFRGLASLSSGYAAVRADDGMCTRHDRYVGARASCADHKSSS